MFEHWQHVALGALCTTPIMGGLWSTGRHWRKSYDRLTAENDRINAERAKLTLTSNNLADQVIGLAGQLADEKAVTAGFSDRLNRIITRGKTESPNNTVQAMVRIAEGG